jgi:hypothetical protein
MPQSRLLLSDSTQKQFETPFVLVANADTIHSRCLQAVGTLLCIFAQLDVVQVV